MKKPISQTEDTIQREKKYRDIIESISAPLVALDNNWCYTYLNQEAEDLLGLASGHDLIGKNFWEEFQEIVEDGFKEACEKAKVTQRYIYHEQYFPEYNVWMEHHIYPSCQGITINFRNITERKKKEEEAHKLSQRNTLIIDKMRDNFLLTDEKMNIVDVNPAFCKSTGYTREELLTMNVSDFYSHLTKEEVKRNFKEALQAGTLLIETQVKKKNGDIASAEVTHAEMVIDGRTYIATFARDISAYKKAEEKLKQSNERFELIGSTTQDAVWEVELGNGRRWSNEMHKHMYGLQKSDPAPYAWEWEQKIHPDERQQIISSLDAAIKSGKDKWLAEYRFKTENRGWINIYDRTYIVHDEKGKTIRMLGSMMDITELKRAEEQIIGEKRLSDSIINSLPGIFYLFNKKGQFLRWNKNFETVSHYNASEIAGMNPIDFYDEDEKEILKMKINEAFEKGMAEIEAHFFTKKKEKIPYYFNGWITEIKGEKCLIGTGIDITELKKAERSVHEMEQEILNQKVQEQKTISRAIINTQEKERNYIGRELHDNVNQILAGTRLYLSMASKQNERVRELIKYPMELLDNSINEIRLLTHKHATPLRDLDLKQLIKTLLDNLEKSTPIKTSLIYNIQDKIIGDDLKINIYRIIQEQINNITKHANPTNACISIQSNDDKLNIVTKDDGKGFDVNKNREGIGLSNMINRIDSFNGEMVIESTPGKGCVIQIQIPF
ncbi:MAG: PAS domain S-box protein [Ginsengibacter sp.]